MGLAIFVGLAVLFPCTAVVFILYLKSSFTLLELVQQDPGLWNALGQPRKVWIRSTEGGFHTIKPLGPWLSWVWASRTTGISPEVYQRLRRTSRLLKAGIVLFCLTACTALALSTVFPSGTAAQ